MNRDIGAMISNNWGKMRMNRLKKSIIETPLSVIYRISEIALENQINKIKTLSTTTKERNIFRRK
jgi:hypothetical protein